ncbi:MAG: hypothetical protein EAZ25_25300 [Oscillatoriales cyanobacterium]|nr:MAG: hypothetical protein EAZ25_25300 [Oscillatoriales cyanobacterium]
MGDAPGDTGCGVRPVPGLAVGRSRKWRPQPLDCREEHESRGDRRVGIGYYHSKDEVAAALKEQNHNLEIAEAVGVLTRKWEGLGTVT